MISAGEVGAVFAIVDEASPVLKALMDQMNALQGVIDRTKISLKELTFPPGLNRSLANMDRALAGVGASAEAAAVKASAGFVKIDESIGVTQARVAALKAEMNTLGTGVGRGAGFGGGSGRRPGSRGNGLTAEAPPLPLPYGGNIRPSEGSGGFWEIIIGAIGVDAIKHFLSAGGDLETEKKLLRDKLGSRGTEADIEKAVAYARKYATDPSSGVIGESESEALKGIRDLMSVTPSLEAAEKLFPTFMRTAKSLEELTGEKAGKTMPIIAKALENLGGGINPKTHELDPERMQEAANQALMTIVAGGGFIDAATLFGFAKQAGGMGRITTDMGKLFDGAITSLIDVGGQRTGTAFASLGRQFLGDKMTVQTATALEDLGLLPHGSWRKGGGTGIIMNPGFSIKGVDEIKDPEKGLAEWFKDTVAPLIFAKHGGKDATTVADVMEDSYKLFGQQTGQRLALMFLQNEAQRQRDVDIKNGVDHQKVYQGIGADDYAKNIQDVGAAYKTFEENFGGPGVSAAIDGLHLLTAALHGLSNAAAVSPDATKTVLEGGAVASLAWLASGISKFFGGPSLSGAASSVGGVVAPVIEAILGTAAGSAGVVIGGLGLVAAADPNRTDPLSITGDAAGIYERSMRAQQERMRDPEAARGRAMMSPEFKAATAAPPTVNVDVKATTTVTLDGAAIAAAVSTRIEKTTRVTGSSNGQDIQAGPVYPDHAIYHGM